MEELKFKSFQQVQTRNEGRKLARWVIGMFVGTLLFILFVPWTQSVDGKGVISTLRPEQQPHTINSVLSGTIENWYVIEGQHVQKGDTLAFITEVENDYLNPNRVNNLKSQLEAKKSSLNAYDFKIKALDKNIDAIKLEFSIKQVQLKNKILQNRNKLAADSAALVAQEANYIIAQTRFERIDSLFKLKIKSRKDRETAVIDLQDAQNNRVNYINKIAISRNELSNAILESQNYINQFNGKLNKALSDRFSAVSDLNNTVKDVNDLENKVTNVTLREGYYYITAIQESYVFKTFKKGIGEIVKAGEPIISLIPKDHDLAVEMYIRPVDIPLIEDQFGTEEGVKNRIIFDGWPSLVFSGWPNTSFGSFGGEVYAIDKNISVNGMYRVLVIPDTTDKSNEEWPELLKLGSDAKGIFLLNDVPIWYEIWRRFNGFAPEYYNKIEGEKSKGKSKKANLKQKDATFDKNLVYDKASLLKCDLSLIEYPIEKSVVKAYSLEIFDS